MKALVIGCAVFGVALLYLLSQASANSALFAQSYPWLLGLGGVLTLGLMALIGYQLWVLRGKLKARVFGAKLTLRLLVVFTLMALGPGTLVYAISVQFLARSIESWFDVRVDKALEGGLNLARGVLDEQLKELARRAEAMAHTLGESPAGEAPALVNRLREQASVEEATLMNAHGKVIAFSSTRPVGLLPSLPGAVVVRQVRSQQAFQAVEAIPGKGLYLRVVVPVNVLTLTEDIRMLQVLDPAPKALAGDAETVEAVYRDYQELSLARLGLKRVFGLALTLALLLSLLSAIALAFLLSEKLSAPLGALAESTKAIAKGDFSRLNPVASHDELGVLTRSFNIMTRQLADASDAAARNHRQVEAAKAYLERVLGNLSAGVLALDERLYLRTSNAAASRILDTEFNYLKGAKFAEWGTYHQELGSFSAQVLAAFVASNDAPWERQIELPGAGGLRTLLVRGSRLALGGDNDYVIVFDDITHMLQAQRDAAWGEVARRLAHEIKNPLTPIQLSAERLQHKLADKLAAPDADMLRRATDTIVNQVTALKSMVNDFGEYARAARIAPASLALNTLVRDVLVLYESTGVRIESVLAEDIPPVLGDASLLRQVLHNLIQNALDALSGAQHPLVTVATERVESGVRLSVCDNGSGFSAAVMSRIFEPYATTKVRGTGLGLAIVKKIVDEHHGRIHVDNLEPRGAMVAIILPLAEVA